MKWQVGDIKICSVYEQALELEQLIPGATREVVNSIAWLRPNFVDDEGVMRGVIQAFVLETPTHKIVIDTCVGNDKKLTMVENWHVKQTGFMEHFRESGYSPGEIDVVLCTHMHVDHIGWNTWLDGDVWKPTFSNARYLFAKLEYDEFMKSVNAEPVNPEEAENDQEMMRALFGIINRETYAESILPVIEAGLADLVETTHQVCDGIRLIPTHGHTPGHVSVILCSQGEEAIITGDAVHHPVQIARPDLWTIADSSPDRAMKTRKEILEEAWANGQLLIGTHFCDPTVGYIQKERGEYVFTTSKKG